MIYNRDELLQLINYQRQAPCCANCQHIKRSPGGCAAWSEDTGYVCGNDDLPGDEKVIYDIAYDGVCSLHKYQGADKRTFPATKIDIGV